MPRGTISGHGPAQTQPAGPQETTEERAARLAREGEAIEEARRLLAEGGGIQLEEVEAVG